MTCRFLFVRMKLFWGKVIRGEHRGKALGFPTANMRYHHQSADGIYISRAKVGETWHPALTFIGAAKTFGSSVRRAETYILDFNKNLYGTWLSVRLIKKIRNNQRFDSVTTLVKAIQGDEQKARAYFSKKST